MSSLLTSVKSKDGFSCGGNYTSVGLVLFGSILGRIFGFIFLACEPYHMVNLSTVQCPLSVFGVSLPIKRPVQSQFQFLENRVQSLPGEIPCTDSWYWSQP